MNDISCQISPRKKCLFYAVFIIIVLFLSSVIYGTYVFSRTLKLYNFVKTNQRGWVGTVHTADPQLGFTSIPNSSGAMILPKGPKIPVRYDENGFRTPLNQIESTREGRTLAVFLGDSFTFGHATYAKDTFTLLISNHFKAKSINAGIGSFGLAQMFVLANRLVPKYNPDYLIVQYSPWIVTRAMQTLAPSYFGKLPNPYFYTKGKEIVLHSPIFKTMIFDLPIRKYRETPRGFSDFIAFFSQVGFPLFLHDDIHILSHKIKIVLDITPDPFDQQFYLTKEIYHSFANIAHDNDAKLVIVILGNNENPVKNPGDLFPEDSIIVDAHSRLLDNLDHQSREGYLKKYAHWRGNPPTLVDTHPNEIAHKLIAEEIISALIDNPQ